MASLDDSIISDQNLMLLDNVTNYNRASVDYFHHKFDYNKLEMSETWALLLKMRKHKLLRLPSCSSEDDDDYSMYLKRLHHCLWRRWGIDQFHLENNKLDPLTINWNKETDVTVLYGPSLSKDIEQSQETNNSTNIATPQSMDVSALDNDSIDSDTQLDYSSSYDSYSSSVESQTSSIFDSPSILKPKNSNTNNNNNNSTKKTLKFNCMVHRRDIDQKGKFLETNIIINDIDFENNDINNSYTTSLHHNYLGNQHYYDFNSKVEKSTLFFDDDDEEDSDDFMQNNLNEDYIVSLTEENISNKHHHHHHHHHKHNHHHSHTRNHIRTAVRN